MSVKIALLDLDHTLLAANTNSLWHRRRRWPTWRELLEGLPALLSLWTRGAPTLQGISRETLLWSYWLRQLIYGAEYKPLATELALHNAERLRAGARPLLNALREAGTRLILVSASDAPLARAFGEMLNVDEVVAVERDGMGFQRPVPYGDGKVGAVRRYLGSESLEHCAFLSDHFSDTTLLETVGLPVAVNADRRLQDTAKRQGWLQLDLDDDAAIEPLMSALKARATSS